MQVYYDHIVLYIPPLKRNEYNPNSLHHLVCGELEMTNHFLKILNFRMTLDARIRMSGKGSTINIWTQGLLGSISIIKHYILHVWNIFCTLSNLEA